MIYSKKIVFIIAVLFLSIQSTFAFYHTVWQDICGDPLLGIDKVCQPPIARGMIDLDSVNIHNDSIYYAVEYAKSDGDRKVAIIQYKNGKAGIVKTYDPYEYEHTYMMDHINYSHPAYAAKEAENLKDIDKNSFIYETLEIAKEVVKTKKMNPNSLGLHNCLYGLERTW